jgi:hypothetical protein
MAGDGAGTDSAESSDRSLAPEETGLLFTRVVTRGARSCAWEARTADATRDGRAPKFRRSVSAGGVGDGSELDSEEAPAPLAGKDLDFAEETDTVGAVLASEVARRGADSVERIAAMFVDPADPRRTVSDAAGIVDDAARFSIAG